MPVHICYAIKNDWENTMKYLSLTALIVMGTLAVTTNITRAYGQLTPPWEREGYCDARLAGCTQRYKKCESATSAADIGTNCPGCYLDCIQTSTRCGKFEKIAEETKAHGEFCKQKRDEGTKTTEKLAPVVISKDDLQLIIAGKISALLQNRGFREWPKNNIQAYDRDNSEHLMIWAEAILGQHEKKLFTATQAAERKEFESLTHDQKLELIHKALGQKPAGG